MTTEWKIRKLGDVMKLEYGKPLPKTNRRIDGDYPVYGANGEKSRSNDFYYSKPSIIVGRKGSAGELTLTEEKFWPLDVTFFVTYDEQRYDLIFLYRLLETLNLNKLAKGVKPGINRNEIYSIDVKTPALSEQRRIVKILDNVFIAAEKAKENAEKNLENANELFVAFMTDVFTNNDSWKKEKIGDVFTFRNGRSFKKTEWKEAGIPIIRIQNLNNDSAPFNYFTGEFDKQIHVNKGDLLFSWSGTVGSSFGAHLWNKEPGLLNQHIFKVGSKKEVDKDFAYFLLEFITKELEKNVNGSVGLVHVTKAKLNAFEIAFPNVSVQVKLVKRLRSLQEKSAHLERIYRHKLTLLEELKKSVLHKAFAGEL
jgi:type I restriction enzyme S subunit